VRRRRRKKVSNKWWWASSSAVVLMVGFKYGSRALKASRLFFLACFSFFFSLYSTKVFTGARNGLKSP
jgi:hypothetical protein